MNIIFVNDSYSVFNKNEYAVCLGRFDGIHKGHRKLIDKTISYAKENNLKSAVVTFLKKGEKNKIYPLETQKNILESMGIDTMFVVDFSEKFKNLTYSIFIENYLIKYIKARCVVCGYDFKFGKDRMGDSEKLKNYSDKFKVFVIDKVTDKEDTVSSTLVKKLLKEGNIKRVNELLCDRFKIEGFVSKGNMIGRTISFPTANIVVDESICDILPGVYSTIAYVDNKKYMGVSNIGIAPTVRREKKRILETNIIDFDEFIYNKNIKIEFVDFIRNERKFKDLKELKETISDNLLTAKEQLKSDF